MGDSNYFVWKIKILIFEILGFYKKVLEIHFENTTLDSS